MKGMFRQNGGDNRYTGYRANAIDRVKGAALTGLAYIIIACGFFITIRTAVHVEARAPALTVVELKAVSIPDEVIPEPPREPPTETGKKAAEPQSPADQEQAHLPTSSLEPVARKDNQPSSATPAPADIAPSPKPVSTPPPLSHPGQKPDTWESEVLAQLIKHRRYPRMAEFRRQQGVPWIRFVLNRQGKVIFSQLEQSSGFPDLDREAVSLPKRSQPFPAPPANKPGDRFELIVPVEFFLTR